MKKLREIVEATKSLHPMALHVKPVMVNGQQKYKVHAVGKDLADGINHGEHLSDSELDDAHEMGAKVKHVKESVHSVSEEVESTSENKDQMDESHLNLAKNAKTQEEFHSHMLDHHMQMMHVHEALDDSYASERHADKAKQHADKLSKLGNDVTFNEETIIEKITVVQGVAPASHNNKPTTSGGITSGTVYTGRLKPNTPKPAIVKPNRGNTQFRPASAGSKPGAQSALDQARSRMKNTNEEVETTHEDPLVVTKDSEGNIHTHANLSVANAIHQTNVKHQAIHTGKPVKAGKFTFELSKHHASNVKEAMSHQAKTTMKHIPNPSPALKKAAKDIKPGIAGFRDRIAMLKAGGVKEEVEQIDEISTKTLASAAKSASDPDSDYHYGKSHDPQKFADHAKKTKDAKSAAAVQGAADAKGHYTRPGHTLGSYDKLAHRTPARVTSAGKANKQDVNRLKSNIQKNEETDFGPEADKNITVQLKKAMDMMEHGEKTGSDVEFADGQQHFVEGVIAHKVLVAMEQMKPEVRAQAQNAVYQSFAHLMAAHQMLSK